MRTLLSEMVAISQAIENCRFNESQTWFFHHSNHLKKLADNLPSGSGFDSGTEIEFLSDTKAIFKTAFHHINDSSFYNGWTDHKVIVTPTFTGLSIKVSGKNYNDIKEDIAEQFHYVLSLEVDEIGNPVFEHAYLPNKLTAQA